MILQKLINKMYIGRSIQAKLAYSLIPVSVVIVAVVAILITNHVSTPQSAQLVIGKAPLVANSTEPNSLSTSTTLPATANTTTVVSPPSSSTSPVITSYSPVQHTITPSQTPVTPETNTPSPVPTQTPLSALTTVIDNLESGQSADITLNAVLIPGPITDATGQPIVFTANGQTYFAYTQEQEPNFNTTPSQTASTMAIVPEPATDNDLVLSLANLDKSGILVDENGLAVGYSSGGDSGR